MELKVDADKFMDIVKELVLARIALKRVRELMEFYEGKDFGSNPMGYGQLKNESNSISYKVAANNIWKALDGEQ